MSTKETVLNAVEDLVSELLYYGRKEDENLPRGRIEEMIRRGEITVDEIVNKFHAELKESL